MSASRFVYAPLALLIAAPAFAADTLQDLPFGGRTAAMGTTGIARGDDSAMAVINPAGIALLPSTTFSVSASLWGLTVADVPSFNSEGPQTTSDVFGDFAVGQQGVSSSAVHAFPSSVSGMLHFGDVAGTRHIAGLSVMVPSALRRRYAQDLSLANDGVTLRNELAYSMERSRVFIAPSYAVAFGPDMRIGGSLMFSYAPTTVSWSSAMITVSKTNADFWRRVSQASGKGHSLDVGLVFGMQMDLGDAFSAGVVFGSPMLHLTGDWHGDEELTMLDAAGATEVRRTATTGDRIDQAPMRIGVGLAYRFGAQSSIALDGNLYIARSSDQRYSIHRVTTIVGSAMPHATTEEDVEVTVPRRTIFNISAGFETGLWEDARLRAGAFTSFSTEPHFDEPGAVIAKGDILATPVDRFGGSLGLGLTTGPVDSTVGISAAIGRGQTVRTSPANVMETFQPTPVHVYDVFLFVTGTVDASAAAKSLIP